MPVQVSYPGVYVQEIPSGVRTVTGVSTSDTAFVDMFARGPVDQAVRISNYSDFQRTFGGLHAESEGSYAIHQYYQNGGSNAWVVRVNNGGETASVTLNGGGSADQPSLSVSAHNPGAWGNNIQVAADHNTRNPQTHPGEFNLVVREIVQQGGKNVLGNSEVYRNLSMDQKAPRYAVHVVNAGSNLIRLTDVGLGDPPITPNPSNGDVTSPAVVGAVDASKFPTYPAPFVPLTGGTDGAPPVANNFFPTDNPDGGVYALNHIAPFIFNILCLPAASNLSTVDHSSVMNQAAVYCEEKRAFLIIDVPEKDGDAPLNTVPGMLAFKSNYDNNSNAAVYFPRLDIPDPLKPGQTKNVGPSGTLAGIYARTDTSRGIWKAPAGIDAILRNASPTLNITDAGNGDLNMQGVNVLRTFPVYGNISWGARTLEGADLLASEWKYVPVRRLALYIEETLFQNLKWAVFEPNDEPLWGQIRIAVGGFMGNLYRQGAFQGTNAGGAYFVKCDGETTTQLDIDSGIVNIHVGFAPLKPAEFVVISIQQIAGQTA